MGQEQREEIKAGRISSRLEFSARVLGAGVIVVGVAGLAGWAFHLPALRGAFLSLPVMVPNTAIGFVLAGLALILCGAGSGSSAMPVAARASGMVVALLGLVVIGEYIFQWEPGIDLWLFRDALIKAQSSFPGRPSLPTSVNFVLLGAGLLLMDLRTRSGAKPAEWLSITALVISLLALIGHLCNVPAFYGWRWIAPTTGMSVWTVLAFIVLGAGVLCARPAGGLMELLASPLPSGAMARRLILAPVLIPLLTGWTRLVGQHFHLFDAEFAGWLFSFLNILLFTLLIWWSARLLFRAESASRNAEGELLSLNQQLESRISERTEEVSRAMQALRANEERVRLVFDSALDAIITADERGMITGWNKEAEKIFGWSATEIMGRPLAEAIIPLRYREAHERGWQRFLATQEGPVLNRRIEITALRRDGREFPVELSITPIETGGKFVFSGFVRDISERKQAEEKTVWLASFPERNPNPIVEFDWVKRTVHYLNPAAARMFPEMRTQGLQHALLDGLVEVVEDMMKAPSRTVHREASAGGFTFAQTISYLSEAQRVRIYSTDITERHRAEAALRESEARFRMMADRAPVLIWISGTDKLRNWFNQVWLDFVGRPMEKELGNGWAENVHPDDLARCLETYVTAFDARRAFTMEYRMRRHDGEFRWILDHGVPLHRSNGDFAGYIGSCKDVTERKQAMEQIQEMNTKLEERVRQRTIELEAANAELSQSRAELKGLFESLPGLYLILTSDFQIVAVSDAYLKATFTTREGILGRNLFEVFPDNPDDPAADGVSNLRASLDRVRRTKAADIMAIQKYDIRGPDGAFEEHYWSPINSPVLGADGLIKYIVHRVENVTDFVRQKSQPMANNAELRVRMEQMEAEVFQSAQKIQAANLQLEIANKELEAFSYSVSHDLRAPLRHIAGFVELLREDLQPVLTDGSRRQLSIITDSAEQMGNLIDNLLTFSRMGRAEMRCAPVDSAGLVREVLEELKPETQDRDIAWDIAPLPEVFADRALLKQVWANLLSNAIKYTRQRPRAEIKIACRNGGGETEFTVTDNGAGFDMRYADKLFGVFQRLHLADEFEGTGIGLANVRRIVARHGGRTWAEGKVDGGASFHFTLPTPTSRQP